MIMLLYSCVDSVCSLGWHLSGLVVQKVGSFTRCAIHQYTHRAGVLSLLRVCADKFHKASTLLSRVARATYSYKNKELNLLHSDWFIVLHTYLKGILLPYFTHALTLWGAVFLVLNW